jgi:hypothetical protein
MSIITLKTLNSPPLSPLLIKEGVGGWLIMILNKLKNLVDNEVFLSKVFELTLNLKLETILYFILSPAL